MFLCLAAWVLSASSAFAGPPATLSTMVTLPAGEFTMGSTEAEVTWAARTFFSESLEYYQDEMPAHRVHVPAFDIDVTEVTFGQYREHMERTGAAPPRFADDLRFNGADQPVVGVTWQAATDYCVAQGKRLPTEAEWEKAARGGDGRYYPWGNTPEETRANVRGRTDGFRYSAPVGHFPEGASAEGVLDLAGNVWEWTADAYRPYPGNPVPSDPAGAAFKVIRGGSWFSNMDLARTTVRGKALPDRGMNYIGFRCVR